MKKMPIMEIFGPTIQGEGMVIGRKTIFVRTGGCDYSCSWCDSSFTWNGSVKAEMLTVDEVLHRIYDIGIIEDEDGEEIFNFDHVTISGGNPALIGEAMRDLINALHMDGIEVGLETQGSRFQSWFSIIDDLTISPKPPSSGMLTNWERLDEVVEFLDLNETNFSLKVVVFNDKDFEYAKKVNQRYPEVPFYVSVGNEDAAEKGDISNRLIRKLDWLWEKVLTDPTTNGWKPLPQLHTLVWANKRGV